MEGATGNWNFPRPTPRTIGEFAMPSKRSIYTAGWMKRHPGKKHEYYLRYSDGVRRLEDLKAEALARTEKACTKCGVVKPMAEFPKNIRHRDGKDSACLACLAARTGAWKTAKRHARESVKPRCVIPDGHKTCTKCGKTKPVGGFCQFQGKIRNPCKQCARDAAKATYCKDPNRSFAYHAQWCKDHPEQIKGLRRDAYRRAHPESKTLGEIDAERAVRAQRIEKPCKKCGTVKRLDQFGLCNKTADGRSYQCLMCLSVKERQRYARNPEMLIYRKRWNKEHPETGRQVAHRRRARQRGISGSHTLAEWRELCVKFGNRCVCCGKARKLTRDHIVPISNPKATNNIGNLQPLCYSCNSAKGNRRITDYRDTPFTGKGVSRSV
jgi:5-methylcytosine-specific restriction endonuclease McrA